MSVHLSYYYQNVRGLKTKLNEFYRNLLLEDLDAIFLTETGLDESVNNLELFDNKYNIFRCDRNKELSAKSKGGGVLIAVKSKFRGNASTFELRGVQAVMVEIAVANNHFFLCVVYFEPGLPYALYDQFLTELENKASNILQRNIFICGDFNRPEVIDNTYDFSVGNQTSLRIYDFLNFFNLTSYNGIRNANNRTLDLILSSCNLAVGSAPHPLVAIDPHHPAIVASLKLVTKESRIKLDPSNVRYNFSKANFLLLYELLQNSNWNNLNNCAEPDEAVNLFYDILNNCIERSVPKAKFKNNKYPPWFDSDLIRLVKLKKYFHKNKNKTSFS